MDEKFLVALVGAAAGAVGYWINVFWMKPILQYREIRGLVLIDLIFFAQVINADGLNDRMRKLYEERIEANRKRSAQLSACVMDLPGWYLKRLAKRGHSPERAAVDLIGFSNTTDYDAAANRVERIKNALGIKSDRV